jgi:hypothetical protein
LGVLLLQRLNLVRQIAYNGSMRNPLVLFFLALFVMGGIALGIYVYSNGVPLLTTGKIVPPTQQGTFTTAELASHNTSTDCYIAYKGTVYNITNFIPQHPGGPQIMQQCGRVVDDFAQIHPGGSFEKPEIQAVLRQRVVGKLR